MNATRRIRRLVVPVTLAVLLAACANGDTGDDNGEAGSISINGCDPENPFIPTNTSEPCGGGPMDQMFTGLVSYNPDTAEPENAVASDVSSDTTSRGK
jgi:oligopeptide transport system substrate-binding protein